MLDGDVSESNTDAADLLGGVVKKTNRCLLLLFVFWWFGLGALLPDPVYSCLCGVRSCTCLTCWDLKGLNASGTTILRHHRPACNPGRSHRVSWVDGMQRHMSCGAWASSTPGARVPDVGCTMEASAKGCGLLHHDWFLGFTDLMLLALSRHSNMCCWRMCLSQHQDLLLRILGAHGEQYDSAPAVLTWPSGWWKPV